MISARAVAMKFHAPIDDVQWKKAADDHRTMRSHLRDLRRRFAPRTAEEVRLLAAYRQPMQDFGRELLKPLDRISVSRLNELSEQCVAAFVVYLAGRRRR